MTHKNKLESYLFSAIGVAAMLLLLGAVYLIAGVFKARLDLTEEKAYTLSEGTRAILKDLDTPVEIRFYVTQEKDMNVGLKTFAQRVDDLLDEYKKASKGRVIVKKFNPLPDSDAEESATVDGVQGQMAQSGDRIYLGLAVSQLDSKVALPFLPPERERLLEYDISRAIARVMTPEKAVVGVMSSLGVMGQAANPMMMMRQQQGQEPWLLISELQQDFEVREIEASAEAIPEEVRVLLVIHPKNFTPQAQYAIDQYLLKGGTLILFLDPFSVADAQTSMQPNPMQAATQSGSDLPALLKAWGINYDASKVVADQRYVTQINQGGQPQANAAVLSLTGDSLSKDDVITSQVDNLLMPFVGAFTGTPAEGLTKTDLIQTSPSAHLVDRFMAQFSGEQMSREFTGSGEQYTLAMRLRGKFKTAFPDGAPAGPEGATNAVAGLKEAENEGTVVLFSDVDFIYHQFAARVQNFLGQRIVSLMNGNLGLAQGAIEQMAGSQHLIGVRSRATMVRPFTRVREMQEVAEERYRAKIRELEQSLTETQTRLNQLQATRSEDGQRFILSPEQQAELQKFRQREKEVSKELRVVKRDLKREIDSLENRLKWLNIAAMPLLVTFSGIGIALVKRKRTAAK